MRFSRIFAGWLGVLTGLLSGAGPAAAEATTYTYDALGRLIASTTTGGSNNGVNTKICLDAAGNRAAYVTYLSGTASCTNPATPTPPTPPTPPPPPSPPPPPP